MKKVVAAAIKDKEGNVHSLPAPARHHNIINHMSEKNIRPGSRARDQGFIDEDGNFLDREEARLLVIKTGQCPKPDHSRELFSEDLW